MAITYATRHIKAKPIMDNPGLKPWPLPERDAQDDEVIAMVNNNPSRKVDLDTIPPIVFGEDGRMYFMDTAPTLRDTFAGILTVFVTGWGILNAILGAGTMFVCLAADLPVPMGILKGCLAGVTSAAFALSALGGKANGKKKND